ncbi:hypothetical protein EDD86DRAFT_274694 [Gorgonomyces haynaldii]|nr:hypothetical protein EDD86DRAFT_274694 [Gorgonomyces haynaldii]
MSKDNIQNIVPRLRYPYTMQCHKAAVEASATCKQTLDPICADTCVAYQTSLGALLADPKVCSTPVSLDIQRKREQLLQDVSIECQLEKIQGAIPNCVTGMSWESSNCGFGNTRLGVDQAKQYCIQRPNDPCCSQPLKIVDQNQAFRPVIQSADVPQTGASSQQQLSIGWIIFISLGCVALIALCIFLYRHFLLRKEDHKTNPDHRSMDRKDKPTLFANLSHSDFTSQVETALASEWSLPPLKIRKPSVARLAYKKSTPQLPPAPLEKDDVYTTIVVQEYVPTESDEMHLHPGDTVQVYQVFEDGWGIGRNISTGANGLFPVVCLGAFAEFETLKKLVTELLEKKGVMQQMKAELKTHVFTTINETTVSEKPKITGTPLDVVVDFLQTHGLKQTLSCLKSECDVTLSTREALLQKLGVSVDEKESVLDALVSRETDLDILKESESEFITSDRSITPTRALDGLDVVENVEKQ